MQLYGYSNSLSYRAGGAVSVMANADMACEADVDLVALRTENQKLIATKIDWRFSGRRHIGVQQHCVGSFVAVKSLVGAIPSAFSVGAWIWPTLTGEVGQRQGILGNLDEAGQGFALALEGTDLVFVGRTTGGDEVEIRIAKTRPTTTPHVIGANLLACRPNRRSSWGRDWKRNSARRDQQFANQANNLLSKQGGDRRWARFCTGDYANPIPTTSATGPTPIPQNSAKQC